MKLWKGKENKTVIKTKVSERKSERVSLGHIEGENRCNFLFYSHLLLLTHSKGVLAHSSLGLNGVRIRGSKEKRTRTKRKLGGKCNNWVYKHMVRSGASAYFP